VRDGTNGAGRFTRVATNADLGVNQVLIDDGGFSKVRHGAMAFKCLVKTHVIELDWHAVDTHGRWRDPVRKLTGFDDAAHQARHKRTVFG
jgi:hypothetical protein